ncbi:MAG TPA: SpoIID/LytB domain-containing protein [Candidatus Saccharimonadales bacterium]|nr:SpoIID/LytB domain-containing protein [Candidatus Saccharimonadales bacterium]
MKGWALLCCGWFAAAPSGLLAQDVRVRLYTNHAPSEITVTAVAKPLHWRACATCDEITGSSLKIGGNNSNEGDVFRIAGNYQLRPLRGPLFSGNHPLTIEERNARLLVTVAMPLEEYVAAVLAAESGDFKNDESMKAMAVAARTYALRFAGQHEKDGFDFCDTTHCQVVGWRGGNERIQRAVNATRGEILRFGETPAETYYHANCGGMTAAATEAWPSVRASYLSAHQDPYCATSGTVKWESTIAASEIDRVLREAGLTVPKEWNAIEIASRTGSGRVERLQLRGGAANAGISGSSFRFAVDRALGWNKIRSDLYDVRSNGVEIVFSGRGSGHGVGLCQAGAEEMARQGKPYREILTFYYPGTQIAPAPERRQWQKRSSERLELLSTQPEQDAEVLRVAEKVLTEDQAAVGWPLGFRPRVQIFPTLDAYRNSTGQPGWVAASTRGRVIRLQPLLELQRRSIVESTLRHELLHLLIEARAKAGTPLWFREGLVLFFSAPSGSAAPPLLTAAQMEAVLRQSLERDELERAYRSSQSRVATLIQQNGKEAVLGWLSSGIPREAGGPDGVGSASHN